MRDLAGACIPDGTGGKRNDHSNIDDCADNCAVEMVLPDDDKGLYYKDEPYTTKKLHVEE